VTFDEVVYPSGPLGIIDARGVWEDGTHWRDLVHFGESASYSKVDAQTANVLDKFMDGACLKPLSPPSTRSK
jgi:hypothetical protein